MSTSSVVRSAPARIDGYTPESGGASRKTFVPPQDTAGGIVDRLSGRNLGAVHVTKAMKSPSGDRRAVSRSPTPGSGSSEGVQQAGKRIRRLFIDLGGAKKEAQALADSHRELVRTIRRDVAALGGIIPTTRDADAMSPNNDRLPAELEGSTLEELVDHFRPKYSEISESTRRLSSTLPEVDQSLRDILSLNTDTFHMSKTDTIRKLGAMESKVQFLAETSKDLTQLIKDATLAFIPSPE